jgi:hypothetical protein
MKLAGNGLESEIRPPDERPGSGGAGDTYLQAEVLLTINKGEPVAYGTIAIITTWPWLALPPMG